MTVFKAGQIYRKLAGFRWVESVCLAVAETNGSFLARLAQVDYPDEIVRQGTDAANAWKLVEEPVEDRLEPLPATQEDPLVSL